MGVFAPLVGVIGAVQAAEALKLLAGCGRPLVGRLLMLDGRAWNGPRCRSGATPAARSVRGAGLSARQDSAGVPVFLLAYNWKVFRVPFYLIRPYTRSIASDHQPSLFYAEYFASHAAAPPARLHPRRNHGRRGHHRHPGALVVPKLLGRTGERA
jgi:hypothetical protein